MLKLESIPLTRKPTVVFVSWYCPTRTSFLDTVEEDFQRVTQNLFFAGDCVQPQEKNTEEGIEKQQTLKALLHISFPFSKTLVVKSACSL